MRRTGSIGACVLLVVAGLGCGARSGLRSDDAGVDAEPCVPSGAETCDGIDQDCDGVADEDVAPRRCGVDVCAFEIRCEGGAFAECVPRTPAPEACNAADDDCDGAVDEDLGFGPLGDTITLRRDEFDTGDCTSCSWAFGGTLAPTDDGFVALWNLGLYGGAERPNVYRRFLDRRGRPTGPIELALDDFVLWMTPMRAVEPLPPGGVPNAAVYRVGRDDRFGLLLTPRSGAPTVVQPLSPSGPRNVELMVWTGQRFVAAWERDERVEVASFAADGSDERRSEVASFAEHIGSVTLGVWQDRVGVLVSGYDDPDLPRIQWFYLLDGAGNLLVERVVDLEYASWQRLIGVAAGWVYILPRSRGEPALTQLVTPTFDPLTELAPFADERVHGDSGSAEHYVPLPARGETVAVRGGPESQMHVELWGDRGQVLRAWSGPLPVEPEADDGYFGHPHATVDGSRVLVIWNAGAPNSQPNPVYLRELGCTEGL